MRTARETVADLHRRLIEESRARHDRRRLERELATYVLPHERLELEAIIARHTPEQAREVESILSRVAA